MRCIIQRVNRASIVINGKSGGQIGKGLLVLCAFSDGDDEKTVDYCVEKIANLRIFEDENGKLNRSVVDEKGEVLIVSNFTLYADCSHGTRPDFSKAMKRTEAKPIYDEFVKKMSEILPVGTGMYGEHMELSIYSDGPITVVFDK